MSSDKRTWKCPECGSQVELSIFQLDPFACDACMAKRKAGGAGSPTKSTTTAVAGGSSNPISGLPDVVKFGAALLVGLIVGLGIGFAAGRLTAPRSSSTADPNSRHATTHRDASRPSQPNTSDVDISVSGEEPDESTRPGANYHWVKGSTRKDGTKVKGHWAKDSTKKRQ